MPEKTHRVGGREFHHDAIIMGVRHALLPEDSQVQTRIDGDNLIIRLKEPMGSIHNLGEIEAGPHNHDRRDKLIEKLKALYEKPLAPIPVLTEEGKPTLDGDRMIIPTISTIHVPLAGMMPVPLEEHIARHLETEFLKEIKETHLLYDFATEHLLPFIERSVPDEVLLTPGMTTQEVPLRLLSAAMLESIQHACTQRLHEMHEDQRRVRLAAKQAEWNVIYEETRQLLQGLMRDLRGDDITVTCDKANFYTIAPLIGDPAKGLANFFSVSARLYAEPGNDGVIISPYTNSVAVLDRPQHEDAGMMGRLAPEEVKGLIAEAIAHLKKEAEREGYEPSSILYAKIPGLNQPQYKAKSDSLKDARDIGQTIDLPLEQGQKPPGQGSTR